MIIFTPKHINYIRGGVSLNQMMNASRKCLKEAYKKNSMKFEIEYPGLFQEMSQEIDACQTFGDMYHFLKKYSQ